MKGEIMPVLTRGALGVFLTNLQQDGDCIHTLSRRVLNPYIIMQCNACRPPLRRVLTVGKILLNKEPCQFGGGISNEEQDLTRLLMFMRVFLFHSWALL